MESEFPANSSLSKAPTKRTEEPKKVEKVVTGGVVTRKKSMAKRFRERFEGVSTREVVDDILFDVAIPAFKDLIADSVSQGIERKLFGEVRSSSRRVGSRPGYTAYNRIASGVTSYTPRRDPREEVRPTISRRARANHDFGEILYESRAEATEVLDTLFSYLDQYEIVTVADLYNMSGITPQFTDEKYGWTNLQGTNVHRTRGGEYLINLPRPEPVD